MIVSFMGTLESIFENIPIDVYWLLFVICLRNMDAYDIFSIDVNNLGIFIPENVCTNLIAVYDIPKIREDLSCIFNTCHDETL